MIELPDQTYCFDDVVLDTSNVRLTVSGTVRQLEPKSFRLLQFLVENHGRVVSKDEIMRVVWEDVAVTFDSNTSGQWKVYTVSADGGKPRKMTNSVGTSSNYAASWSHDGGWLYFTSNRSGEAQVWKMPSQGGEAVQVTTKGGVAPLESPDGTTLYYTKDIGTGSIWKMPVGGGTETQLMHSIYRFNYAVTDAGLYFVPRPGKEGTASVQFFDFARGALKTIIETGYPDLGLAISPDGRYLLFEQIDYASDLMLIDGFH
jgi:Tol biopolymer transport system component